MAQTSRKVHAEGVEGMAVLYGDIRTRILTVGEDDNKRERTDIKICLIRSQRETESIHGLDTLDLMAACTLKEATFRSLVEERCPGMDVEGNDAPIELDPLHPSPSPSVLNAASGSMLVRIWRLPAAAVRALPDEHTHGELLEALHIYRQQASEYNPAFDEVLDGHVGPQDSLSQPALLQLTIARTPSQWIDPLACARLDCHAQVLALSSASASRQLLRLTRFRSRENVHQVRYFWPAVGWSEANDAMTERLSKIHGSMQRVNGAEVDWKALELDLGSTFKPAVDPDYFTDGPSASQAETGEKRKLTDAKSVVNRIKHDPSLYASDVSITYLDRHDGLMTKKFNDWQTDTTDDDFIPTHRVRAFVRTRDGLVLWDREKRIDVFAK